MTNHVVNLSTVYRHLPLVERAEAAASDGYDLVESWWDFDSATPDPAELERFVASLKAAGVRLTAMNSHGGERAAGERGLAGLPDRTEEFGASIRSVAAVAESTGARAFNVTAGLLDPTRWTREQQCGTAARNYREAAREVARFGGTILIEPLADDGTGAYPFSTGYDVVEFLEGQLGDVPNVGLLFDVFHLASNGVDVVQAFRDLLPHIRHVQYADFPGRGAPGTGEINFDAMTREIEESTYAGLISLEYLGAI